MALVAPFLRSSSKASWQVNNRYTSCLTVFFLDTLSPWCHRQSCINAVRDSQERNEPVWSTFCRYQSIWLLALHTPSLISQHFSSSRWTPSSKSSALAQPRLFRTIVDTTVTGAGIFDDVPSIAVVGPSRKPLNIAPRQIAVSLKWRYYSVLFHFTISLILEQVMELTVEHQWIVGPPFLCGCTCSAGTGRDKGLSQDHQRELHPGWTG